MKIFMNNTRDLCNCRDLKADELRVWAGLLSMVGTDLEVPPRAMISKRCLIRTAKVTVSLKTLTENGFLMDTDLKVNPKYISFKSAGHGSAPFTQNSLKEFSRNRTLHAEGLRIFYFLLGSITRDNKVFDTNITNIAKYLGSDRANTSKLITQLKNEEVMSAYITREESYFTISDGVLGALKRR